MKTMIILLFAFLTIPGMAQESQLDKLFDTYSGKEGYTSIYITQYMFDLFSKIADENDPDFENVTKGLTGIKIITVSSDLDAQSRANFSQEILKNLPATVYKDFMIVKDGKQEITFKVHDEGGKISEFVMVVKDPDEPLLLFLEGDINLKNIAKMSKSMDIKGFDKLEKVEEKEDKK